MQNNQQGRRVPQSQTKNGIGISRKKELKIAHKEREREREREREKILYYVFGEREKYDWHNAKSGEQGVQSEGYKKHCMNGGTCKLHVFHEYEQRDKRVGR